jgi:hypothetical protein
VDEKKSTGEENNGRRVERLETAEKTKRAHKFLFAKSFMQNY